ncbi:alpha/beta hydrolase [Actinoplanes sp. NPDC023801]|uniref:alpha/beta fold hydrolase n=1 Tax=Actinoplanes sp. NPDC023801 TaxID=3154595 RepID=UPI0033D46AA4
MRQVRLSTGALEYEDTGGEGPTLVFLSGLFVGGSLWRHVVADLRRDHRCVVPEMPLGAHRIAMDPDADLSSPALAALVGEFLRVVDLHDVTLIGCDWGGAQLVAAHGHAERVARLVLLPQEAFENYPPGLPGRMAAAAAKVPAGVTLALQTLRVRGLRRTPVNFGLMSKRPVPDQVMDAWLAPALGSAAIRRDVVKYLRGTRRGEYVEAARALSSFSRPALVMWAPECRMMRPGFGARLAEALPQGRLVHVPDCFTLVPEDQPELCAIEIRAFLASS